MSDSNGEKQTNGIGIVGVLAITEAVIGGMARSTAVWVSALVVLIVLILLGLTAEHN